MIIMTDRQIKNSKDTNVDIQIDRLIKEGGKINKKWINRYIHIRVVVS